MFLFPLKKYPEVELLYHMENIFYFASDPPYYLEQTNLKHAGLDFQLPESGSLHEDEDRCVHTNDWQETKKKN